MNNYFSCIEKSINENHLKPNGLKPCSLIDELHLKKIIEEKLKIYNIENPEEDYKKKEAGECFMNTIETFLITFHPDILNNNMTSSAH